VDTLRDKHVLVTGGAGFIGAHLVQRLVDDGADVHVLTSEVSSLFPGRLLEIKSDITVHEGNVVDRSAMDSIARKVRPQVIFHMAAFTHVGKSWTRVDECVQTNVQGTVSLLQALHDVGYERFLNFGTSEIYGDIAAPFQEDAIVNPISPYAVSKYSAERFCRMFHRSYGWPLVMLRPFNAYGPGQTPDRVIPEIIARAFRGQELAMTQGRQTREFNYVTDLVDGFVRAAVTPGIDGEVINIGCGEDVSMRDLATTILDLMGNPITPKFGALPERPAEIMEMRCDNTKARTLLGWEPKQSLADGLAKTIEWYKAELSSPRSPFNL
jgi:nucleoside-diphosphate-sugar epimerase